MICRSTVSRYISIREWDADIVVIRPNYVCIAIIIIKIYQLLYTIQIWK